VGSVLMDLSIFMAFVSMSLISSFFHVIYKCVKCLENTLQMPRCA